MGDLSAGIDSYFYLSLATTFFGGLALITRHAYKSKCIEFECGCIKIKRNIEAEERGLGGNESPSNKSTLIT